MNILVFEDAQVAWLHPITTGRPAYAISCGTFRLLDLLQQLRERQASPTACYGIVRPYLTQIQAADFATLAMPPGDRQATLLLNARVVPSLANLEVLTQLAAATESCVIRRGSIIAAARIEDYLAPAMGELDSERFSNYLNSPTLHNLTAFEGQLDLFDYPHDVVRFNMELISENLEHRIQRGSYEQQADGVFMGRGARLADYVVIDTSRGPIVLEDNASIGPYCYLSGPAWIGPNSRVIEHAAIKDAVSISHTAKIGGEVEASVIEPYTNKQHHGFLGHSYLGSWINLGAGTCNSDLKNTYGEVNMDYGGHKQATQMQFLGCIMGDYSKSAINTGIFTGKTVGVCSMLYGFVTTNVPSFVNYARLFGQVTELPPDVMIATQKRMFARRKVEQRPCDEQLLRDMFDQTKLERQITGEPLQL